MAKSNQSINLPDEKVKLISLIDNFISLSKSNDLRSQVQALIPAFNLLRKLGQNIVSEDDISARDRILLYLKRYPLTIIETAELQVISGITEYQRRIRELRVQFGWPILSGNTVRQMEKEGAWDNEDLYISKMKPSEYIMLDSGQDRDAAHRWNMINALRKQKLSVKDKLIEYFKSNVGLKITGEELVYLAKNAKEWARRVRELRTEEGWSIKTRNTGRPDLPVGVYVLEDIRQAEAHDRKIDDLTRVAVLNRDKFSCRKCGWNHSQKQESDPRRLLELHHLNYHANKGSNTMNNLVTVCNVDHDYIHKKRLNEKEVLNWMGIKSL